MQKIPFPFSSNSQPRTLILSVRDLDRHVSRSYINEFENCICNWEEADFLNVPYFSKTLAKKAANVLSRNFFKVSGNHQIFNPINNHFKLNKKYDLFFYICQRPIDLLYLNSIKDWRNQCSKAVCLIDEVWMKNYPREQRQLSVLKKFDYIFMNLKSSIEAVANTTAKPCYYMAPGVDAVKFCPYPLSPQRSIDVCSFGRRSPTVHQALLELGERENFLYIYDTIKDLYTINYQDHRALYQNIVKRSNYFIAYRAKFNLEGEVGAQEELNVRFFEAASGGAVILGTPPQTETFTQNFDWSDAVIPLPENTTNLAEIIANLDSEPERLNKIHTDNVVNSLLRHDWVYRWEKILDTVGIPYSSGMLERKAKLNQLAKIASENNFTN